MVGLAGANDFGRVYRRLRKAETQPKDGSHRSRGRVLVPNRISVSTLHANESDNRDAMILLNGVKRQPTERHRNPKLLYDDTVSIRYLFFERSNTIGSIDRNVTACRSLGYQAYHRIS